MASAASTVLFIVAFGVMPVANATAIGFLAPVVVTAMAALFLREKVGIRRWSAALVGLAGVMVIVQPGGSTFDVASFIPLCGSIASALAVIGTRLAKERAARDDVVLLRRDRLCGDLGAGGLHVADAQLEPGRDRRHRRVLRDAGEPDADLRLPQRAGVPPGPVQLHPARLGRGARLLSRSAPSRARPCCSAPRSSRRAGSTRRGARPCGRAPDHEAR